MTRREFIAASAAAPLAAPAAVRCKMGFAPDAFAVSRPPRTAIEFLDHAYAVGGGGVQAELASLDPAYVRQVRRRLEELGMYLVVLADPPKEEDLPRFEATVRAAREAGADCIRTACLIGRRYETFETLDQWKSFAADFRARLELAARVAEKHRFPIAVENHKDWTIDEMEPMLKEIGSEYLGVCLDFGNNISLLDDADELVDRLGPFAINAHIKDMGVEEYEEGFLLAEVPLGQGILNLKRTVGVLQKARPNIKFTLDVFTRNPLKIPCLTDKYWATFPERNGLFLARALSMVRKNKPAKPFPILDGLDQAARLKLETYNVEQSLAYARTELKLV